MRSERVISFRGAGDWVHFSKNGEVFKMRRVLVVDFGRLVRLRIRRLRPRQHCRKQASEIKRQQDSHAHSINQTGLIDIRLSAGTLSPNPGIYRFLRHRMAVQSGGLRRPTPFRPLGQGALTSHPLRCHILRPGKVSIDGIRQKIRSLPVTIKLRYKKVVLSPLPGRF